LDQDGRRTDVTSEPVPSAEAQLAFLTKVQRLFAEGEFTATYKYALLAALADIAVELGQDDGAELRLRLGEVAERFIVLYWRQTMPYAAPGRAVEPGVLVQNLGAQAAVVKAIEAFQRGTGLQTLPRAQRHKDFKGLVQEVGRTVSAQPLNFLQNLGGKADEFLYRRSGRGEVCLLPGVAYCLRRFHLCAPTEF
jgi:hypothetical protein